MNIPADVALHMLREGNERYAEGRQLPHFTAAERQRVVKQPATVGGRRRLLGLARARRGALRRRPGRAVRRSRRQVTSSPRRATRACATPSRSWGTTLVVVLGHEDCGAVAASRNGSAPEWLAPVTDHIHTDAADARARPSTSTLASRSPRFASGSTRRVPGRPARDHRRGLPARERRGALARLTAPRAR